MTERSDKSEASKKRSKKDDLRADRETNYAQGSWIGGGRTQPMLSAERLSDAFESDPTHDPKHDSSWRTHKVEEDDENEQSKE